MKKWGEKEREKKERRREREEGGGRKDERERVAEKVKDRNRKMLTVVC